MKKVTGSLYTRLALALLGLLTFLGLLQLVISLRSSQLYEQELTQRLNRELAANLVNQDVLLVDGEVNEQALEGVFRTLSVINPNIDCYLVDLEGRIVTHSAPPGRLERERVDIEPINRMMGDDVELPVLGDDPRDATRRTVFSFSPLMVEDSYWGYLYVVLESEDRQSMAQVLAGNHMLRLGLGLGAGALAVALAAGLLLFNVLTRPLRQLTTAVEAYRTNDFATPPSTVWPAQGTREDEIGVLSRAFSAMSERIGEQVRRLRQTDELRRELIANVSHDLRTPLATLTGYLETLELKEDSLTPEQRREYLAVAARQGDRLGTLVEELFELARLESTEMRPSIEPFPLAELVQDVVQDFRLRAEKAKIRLEMQTPKDVPLVSADIGLIQRVLQNLIGNALKHTESGGAVTLAVEPADDRVAVRVIDTGCGIPEGELVQVFERFYQAQSDDASPRATGGLGLAIVRKILELHGSAVHAVSEVDRGTVFSFSLPAAT